MKYVNHIATDKSIVVVTDEGMFQILAGTAAFTKAKDLLNLHKWDEAVKLVHIPSRLKAYSGGKFIVIDGQVSFNNETLPNVLSRRLLEFCENDIDAMPLINFWENLRQNPSEDSKKDLFAFLEHNHIPLTSDGCFVGYKRVDDEFLSHHEGVWEKDSSGEWILNREKSYDHTPGNIVSMPREKVDPIRDNTCSDGLHVAAFAYAKDKYTSAGKLIEIKVNPKDVVCVPPDYNQEKMRVCKYESVRECVEEYKKPLYEHDNSYSNTPVNLRHDDDEEIDFIEEADDADAEVEKLNLSQKLVVDRHGRLRIPAAMIRAIGADAGDTVHAFADNNNKSIGIFTNYLSGGTPYIVDEYCNIRIGGNVLSDAGLGRRVNINANYEFGSKVIALS